MRYLFLLLFLSTFVFAFPQESSPLKPSSPFEADWVYVDVEEISYSLKDNLLKIIVNVPKDISNIDILNISYDNILRVMVIGKKANPVIEKFGIKSNKNNLIKIDLNDIKYSKFDFKKGIEIYNKRYNGERVFRVVLDK